MTCGSLIAQQGTTVMTTCHQWIDLQTQAIARKISPKISENFGESGHTRSSIPPRPTGGQYRHVLYMHARKSYAFARVPPAIRPADPPPSRALARPAFAFVGFSS
jgi:hypothetical protein